MFILPIFGINLSDPATDDLLESRDEILTKGSGATPIEDGTGTGHFYEEGTWTPAIKGSSTDGTYSFTTGFAYYKKVGNLVFLSANLTGITESSAGTGDLEITGLPETPANFAYAGGLGFESLDLPAGTVYCQIQVRPSGSRVALRIRNFYDNAASDAVGITAISSGNTNINFSIVYHI